MKKKFFLTIMISAACLVGASIGAITASAETVDLAQTTVVVDSDSAQVTSEANVPTDNEVTTTKLVVDNEAESNEAVTSEAVTKATDIAMTDDASVETTTSADETMASAEEVTTDAAVTTSDETAETESDVTTDTDVTSDTVDGDLNNDGVVNVLDLCLLKQKLVQAEQADESGDDSGEFIDPLEVSRIKAYVLNEQNSEYRKEITIDQADIADYASILDTYSVNSVTMDSECYTVEFKKDNCYYELSGEQIQIEVADSDSVITDADQDRANHTYFVEKEDGTYSVAITEPDTSLYNFEREMFWEHRTLLRTIESDDGSMFSIYFTDSTNAVYAFSYELYTSPIDESDTNVCSQYSSDYSIQYSLYASQTTANYWYVVKKETGYSM